MHVLILCKRQYTSRDLLDDRYGRLYEIPEALARQGHRVSGLSLSYRRRPDDEHVSDAGVRWRSINVLPLGFVVLVRHVLRMRRTSVPDVVWASSDAVCVVLGRWVARLLRVPLVVDLYDNYESFGLSRVPFLTGAFRRACRRAGGISVVSHTLADHVLATIAPRGAVAVIGNAADASHFRPLDRRSCREQLGLPLHASLIGCAGALDASRGISDMFEAFMRLAASNPDLYLVIAGPRDDTPARYVHPRIIDLGLLPWQRVPLLLNSLDVSIVCNREGAFGCYCYPLKLHESLACGVPVAAAAVGEVPRLLGDRGKSLYPAGQPEGLMRAVSHWLGRTEVPQVPHDLADWPTRSASLSDLLARVSASC